MTAVDEKNKFFFCAVSTASSKMTFVGPRCVVLVEIGGLNDIVCLGIKGSFETSIFFWRYQLVIS